ncbi:Aste57867_14005 [Aphanomyces stellatus]|uniref:Aste57867_14005 protein n=1 Tax=Aphanomyces stellatus TaxID=120398 RepID=A0A485L039_9STRA|nr:hypothetical protein As57867_013954 [Aphanomyces stellatus]VFT90835.1 Aste57867_14005 [Aphanomyces stellatus]
MVALLLARLGLLRHIGHEGEGELWEWTPFAPPLPTSPDYETSIPCTQGLLTFLANRVLDLASIRTELQLHGLLMPYRWSAAVASQSFQRWWITMWPVPPLKQTSAFLAAQGILTGKGTTAKPYSWSIATLLAHCSVPHPPKNDKVNDEDDVLAYDQDLYSTARTTMLRIVKSHVKVSGLVHDAKAKPAMWLADVMSLMELSGRVERAAGGVWRDTQRVTPPDDDAFDIPNEGALVANLVQEPVMTWRHDLEARMDATTDQVSQDCQLWWRSAKADALHSIVADLTHLALLEGSGTPPDDPPLPDEAALLGLLAATPSRWMSIRSATQMVGLLQSFRATLPPTSAFRRWWVRATQSPGDRTVRRLISLGIVSSVAADASLSPSIDGNNPLMLTWHPLMLLCPSRNVGQPQPDDTRNTTTTTMYRVKTAKEKAVKFETRPPNGGPFREKKRMPRSNTAVGPTVRHRPSGQVTPRCHRRNQTTSHRRRHCPRLTFPIAGATTSRRGNSQVSRPMPNAAPTLQSHTLSRMPSFRTRTTSSRTSFNTSSISSAKTWTGSPSTISSAKLPSSYAENPLLRDGGLDEKGRPTFKLSSLIALDPKRPHGSTLPKANDGTPDDDIIHHGASGRDQATVVSIVDKLKHVIAHDPVFQPESTSAVAVACATQRTDDSSIVVSLLVLATDSATYVVDCSGVGMSTVVRLLQPLLTRPTVPKIVFDLYEAIDALLNGGCASGLGIMAGANDLQLVMEVQTGSINTTMDDMLVRWPGRPNQAAKDLHVNLSSANVLPTTVLKDMAGRARHLLDRYDGVLNTLTPALAAQVQQASDARAASTNKSGQRIVTFDRANNCAAASIELLAIVRPQDMVETPPLVVHSDLDLHLSMLAPEWAAALAKVAADVTDIYLDKCRQPWIACRGTRRLLCDNTRPATDDDIGSIVTKVVGFGTDNRAGLEKQLHRIRALRSRNQGIVGLTMRVGRHVPGLSTLLLDILLASEANVLFLGEPGTGKTTILRDVARELAMRHHVCITDTTNDIAGADDVPHPCVGHARRIIVPSLDAQSAIMADCVQNHTPDVLLVDEIGRASEVEAAQSCQQRGVRVVASAAAGSLRRLLKIKSLRGLVDGTEASHKEKPQSMVVPIFDVVVELQKGEWHAWQVVTDVAGAVDAILKGKTYKTHVRTRHPDHGICMQHLEA